LIIQSWLLEKKESFKANTQLESELAGLKIRNTILPAEVIFQNYFHVWLETLNYFQFTQNKMVWVF